MHYLHRILVYIPELQEECQSKKELRECIRSAAVCQTEDYYGQVFDWRETDNAGRWSDIYPKQVYIASDNLDWFVKELQDVMELQYNNY